jgi:hypothetical protein
MQQDCGYARPQCSSLTSTSRSAACQELPPRSEWHHIEENESALIIVLHTVTLHAKTLRAKKEGKLLACKRAIDCLEDALSLSFSDFVLPDKP